ncbi:hypothetical protein OG818_26215 [Streptomyces virginiae]|uniref:hypothetical protein n=1 Tax=Streptomyces virginiae TaxID=1961 RepID=UPI00225408A6|nr:hypothetical protein [Streptomyces virginiae]MCX4719231.1 hypothetical protein [Streptomyces virginiae]
MTGEPTTHDTENTAFPADAAAAAEDTGAAGGDRASGDGRPHPGDRLRPGTAVTPLRAGLHLRGRRGSLTLEGSTAVPVVWGLLEEPLRTGGLAGFREGLEPGSAVRAATDTLLGRLADHDLLLPAPPAAPHPLPDPAVARWIDATAAHPDAAAALLATARAEVLASDPNSPTATAAVRALTAGGVPVTLTPDPDLPPDRILLTVRGTGPDRAVAAGRGGATGYVTAPGSTAQARADAAALEARLTHAADSTVDSAAEPQHRRIPGTFAVLLAGAAAHRLLCAAARLPDPATEADDPRLLPGIPAVLLADARPARADHHSWLGPDRIDADRHVRLAPPAGLAEALRRIAALGEHRLGPLPAPLPGDLPQLPVPLAACTPPAPAAGHATTPRTLTGGGPRLDLARLELFCRAAELLLGETTFTVGADPGHARGRALRRTAARRLATAPHDHLPPDPAHWSGHPQLRHWWTTLTGRLAVPARLEVHRAAPHAHAYRAVVRRTPHEPGPGCGPGPLLGEAVEATPGDAAAFAALAAVTAVTTVRTAAAAAPGAPPPPSGGAAAPLATAGVPTAAWEDPGWTGGWLADLAGREEALQDTLHRLYGAGPTTTPPAPAPPARDPGLAGLLSSFGFTVLHTPEEAR